MREGRAQLAMLPIENSVAGRVADIHHLMPDSDLHIIGEHFQRVNHHLLALPGATLAGPQDGAQPRPRAVAMPRADPRARAHSRWSRPTPRARRPRSRRAATRASPRSPRSSPGKIYGLVSLKQNIEDAEHNTTRFLVMAREPRPLPADCGLAITTFVFRVRNVPAALYKALGGFATNGVNMTKLESYMVGGRFTATQFYADVEGHPEDRPLSLALEELRFFSREVKILGIYPAHPSARRRASAAGISQKAQIALDFDCS